MIFLTFAGKNTYTIFRRLEAKEREASKRTKGHEDEAERNRGELDRKRALEYEEKISRLEAMLRSKSSEAEEMIKRKEEERRAEILELRRELDAAKEALSLAAEKEAEASRANAALTQIVRSVTQLQARRVSAVTRRSTITRIVNQVGGAEGGGENGNLEITEAEGSDSSDNSEDLER